MILLEVLGPVVPVLGHGDLQPGLHVAVEVDHSSLGDDAVVEGPVVAEPQHVPRLFERLGQLVEGDQPRRQRPQLPQRPVFVLRGR